MEVVSAVGGEKGLLGDYPSLFRPPDKTIVLYALGRTQQVVNRGLPITSVSTIRLCTPVCVENVSSMRVKN